MSDSFEDYAAEQGLTPRVESAEKFFDRYPNLLDEVVRIRQDHWEWADIHRWLRDKHDCQLKSPTTIRMHLQKIGRI